MDGNGIREASVIVAPPDTCPNCQRHHVHAYTTNNEALDLIRGFYRCPDCNLYWGTTWRIEPR